MYEGPFGRGWHWTYDLAIAVEDDAIVIRMADGRPFVFPFLLDGEEFTNVHEKMTLRREGNDYIMRDEHGMDHYFGPESDIVFGDQERLYPIRKIQNLSGHHLSFF